MTAPTNTRTQRRQNMTDEEWLEVPHSQNMPDEEWLELRTLTINWAALSNNPAAIHLLEESGRQEEQQVREILRQAFHSAPAA